jgi:serine/threonine protein phosphatase PrpC
MRRRKFLRRVAVVGVLMGVVVYLVHPSTLNELFAMLAGLVPAITAALLGALQPLLGWAGALVDRFSLTQLVVGAIVAWAVFVVALVLLARSGRQQQPIEAPWEDATFDPSELAPEEVVEVEVIDESVPAEVGIRPSGPYRPTPNQPRPYRRETPNAGSTPSATPGAPPEAALRVPPLPSSPPRAPASGDTASGDPAQHLAVPSVDAAGTAAGVAGVGSAAASSRGLHGPAVQPSTLPDETVVRHQPARPRGGHVLALAGITPTHSQLLPYGLFLLAEDVGSPEHVGVPSKQTIERVAEQIVPCLVSAEALSHEQLASLLNMAVIRASIDLSQRETRNASHLGAKLTGVMVVGAVAHVVNVGDCRTYLFRPDAGLSQVTTDHSVVSCLVQTNLLEPEAVYSHPRREQVYRSVGGSQGAIAVDAFEVSVRSGDLLVLCSARLWHGLRHPQMEAILRAEPDPRHAADALARAGEEGNHLIVVRPSGTGLPAFGLPSH